MWRGVTRCKAEAAQRSQESHKAEGELETKNVERQ